MSEDWIRDYIGSVLTGHGGRTANLVNIVQCNVASNNDRKLAIPELLRGLNQEPAAVGRNRILRRWLSERPDAVAAAWMKLGFPLSPEPPPSLALVEPTPRRRASSCREGRAQPWHMKPPSLPLAPPPDSPKPSAVLVLDFDKTLTIKHVGPFENMDMAVQRVCGGWDRFQWMQSMLEHVCKCNVATAIVTRNSKHVVCKIMHHLELMPYITQGLLFGFEDYDDNVPKSWIIRERILGHLSLAEGSLLFVDDDATNIGDVQNHLPNAAILLSFRLGLTYDQFNEICKWADGQDQ